MKKIINYIIAFIIFALGMYLGITGIAFLLKLSVEFWSSIGI